MKNTSDQNDFVSNLFFLQIQNEIHKLFQNQSNIIPQKNILEYICNINESTEENDLIQLNNLITKYPNLDTYKHKITILKNNFKQKLLQLHSIIYT